MRPIPMNHNADPIRDPMTHDAEQAHLSSTDKADLNAAVHNANIPIDEGSQDEEIMVSDAATQESTENPSAGDENQ